ncbi:MAG: VWA domain-containing protein [Flavobacteriaceae bacterium]|nr:VWA domain-containing protein [Flavobacteriaceae bacterium]
MTITNGLYILLAAIIAILMAVFQYYYREKHRRPVLAVLRFFSVLSILLLIINPSIKSRQFTDVKPVLNILIDNSGSIAFARQEANVRSVLSKIKNNSTLTKRFDLKLFPFSNGLDLSDSLSFDKPETDIRAALKSLQDIEKGKTGPTILISDGNQTHGSSYAYFTSPKPVYPIVLGDTTTAEDLKISLVNANAYSSLNNQFPVEVFLMYQGDRQTNQVFTVYEGGTVVFKKPVAFSKEKNSQKIDFYLKANSVGKHDYTATISSLANEKNTLNNTRYFSVEVVDEQAAILILSAITHPDIGMIKRSIERNKQRKVSIENDLGKDIKLKDYQLIILYQPNSKFNNILNRIVSEKINFLIITGTGTDWSFLNAGQPYFKKDRVNSEEEYGAYFNRSFDRFIVDDPGFDSYPPLEDTFGKISFTNPYETLLFQSIKGIETGQPLLAVFSDDTVRRAALFGENSWKWRMATKIEQQSFQKFDDFFGKLIQYLSSDKRANRLELFYEPVFYGNSRVQISAQYYDANYSFDPNADLEIRLGKSGDDQQIQLPLTLQNENYTATFDDLKPGTYQFTVQVLNTSFKKSGSFKILDYNLEQQRSEADLNQLKALAKNTDGEVIYSSGIDSFINNLATDEAYPVIQQSTEKLVSLIDKKWLLALIVIFLSAEWLLRKYKGLI